MIIDSSKETLNKMITSIVVASEIDKNGKHVGVIWVEPCTSQEEDKSTVFDDLIDLLNRSEDKQITLRLDRDDFGACVLYAKDSSGICTEYKSIQNRGRTKISTATNSMSENKKEVIICENCQYWVAGNIDDDDHMIPPKCTLTNQPSYIYDYCSKAKKKEK